MELLEHLLIVHTYNFIINIIFKRFLTESINYIYINLIKFFFSFFNPNTFYNTASTNIVNSRRLVLKREDTRREDLFIVNRPDQKEEDTGRKILYHWLGKPGKAGSHENRDKEYMQKFLSKSKEDSLPKVKGLDVEDYLPGKAPLITYLKVDLYATVGGYQFPPKLFLEKLSSRCSLDEESLLGIEIREVTLGKSSENKVMEILDWAVIKIRENQTMFPGEACSFHVEEFSIPVWKYNELKRIQKNSYDDPKPLIISVPHLKQPNCRKLPSRILIGDGVSWVLSIRFNFDIFEDENGKKFYKLSPSTIPEVFYSFLKTLPYLYGYESIHARDLIKDTLIDIYGVDVILPDCLETESLATAAGWKPDTVDLSNANLITMGGLLNLEIMGLDQLNCLEWVDLPDEFKIYFVGIVRFGYSNYIILMGLLMRNLFPDIDALCSTIELRQPETIKWFAWLVGKCIGETSVSLKQKNKAETRIDLVKSLRKHVISNGQKYVESSPDFLICLFSQLIPDWPTVVYGGPRYLHSVLPFFVEQIQLLQGFKETHPRLHPLIIREIDDNFIRSCTYNRGMFREDEYEGCEFLGLECKPSLEHKVFNLDINAISNMDISALATQTGQAKVLGVLEFVRLHPNKINSLLSNINRIDLDQIPVPFWLERVSLYERIRLMHLFLFNVPSATVPRIDEEVRSRHQNVVQQEISTRRKDEKVLENRRSREELFQANISQYQGSARSRVGIQQQIYNQVPGDHHKRNLKWRNSKKKMYARVKGKDQYIPRKVWKALGKKGLRPTEGSVEETSSSGRDLRQVLDKKRKDLVVLEAQNTEYQSRPKPLNNVSDYDDPMEGSSSGAKRARSQSPDWNRYVHISESKRDCQGGIFTPGQYSPRGSPARGSRSISIRRNISPSFHSRGNNSPDPSRNYESDESDD